MKQHNQAILLILLTTSLAISCVKDNPEDIDPVLVPTVTIEADVPIGWDTKGPCTITYSAGSTYKELPAIIKYRGGSSAKYGKHSFSIELEKKYNFLFLPNDDDWILNASYIDKTFMRHKISYDLFRQMSRDNISSKSMYVNVSVNGQSQGLYLLMEEVNGGMAGIDKTDSMSMMFKDPPLFYEDRIPAPQDPLNYYQQKYPKIHETDKTWYIEKFKDFLFNSTDAVFLEKVNEWVDIRNITDWHILLFLTNNSDGIMKNFYLYKRNATTPFQIAIWDYDHSFGRDGDNELNMMERELNCSRSILIRRLMETPGSEYPENLKNRWLELRNEGIISLDNILEHISRNNRLIKDEVEKNFEIWPADSKWYFDGNGYQEEVELIKTFTSLRIDQLDNRFSNH